MYAETIKSVAIKSVAVAGALAAAMTLTPSPASAAPSKIDYGFVHSASGGDSAYAVFTGGSGQIRATMGCISGTQHWTVYGPWKKINVYSWTSFCATRESNYYQT